MASLSNCQTSCGALVALQHRHILRMSKSFLRLIPYILAVNVQSSRRNCLFHASQVSSTGGSGCLMGATYTHLPTIRQSGTLGCRKRSRKSLAGSEARTAQKPLRGFAGSYPRREKEANLSMTFLSPYSTGKPQSFCIPYMNQPAPK